MIEKRKEFRNLAIGFMLIISHFGLAQIDSLYLANNEILIGELKSMNRNVAVMETDYSDADFKIVWDKIKRLATQSQFLITLKSGDRYFGSLKGNSTKVMIYTDTTSVNAGSIENIVYLKELDQSFWERLNASLSLGYNYTKANNLSQFSIRSHLTYATRKWLSSVNYNQIFSEQNEANTTRRLDAKALFNYFFKKKWFAAAEINWLSNTEQNINLRTLSKLGIGRYMIQTNTMYWAFQTGVSFNNESFNVDNNLIYNNSAEAYLGTEANLYDIGDLNLLARAVVYPSITESKRFRTDLNFDVQYDLPLDFFIQLGISLNYDNQPAQDGSETDYVFQTTFGWSL